MSPIVEWVVKQEQREGDFRYEVVKTLLRNFSRNEMSSHCIQVQTYADSKQCRIFSIPQRSPIGRNEIQSKAGHSSQDEAPTVRQAAPTQSGCEYFQLHGQYYQLFGIGRCHLLWKIRWCFPLRTQFDHQSGTGAFVLLVLHFQANVSSNFWLTTLISLECLCVYVPHFNFQFACRFIFQCHVMYIFHQ